MEAVQAVSEPRCSCPTAAAGPLLPALLRRNWQRVAVSDQRRQWGLLCHAGVTPASSCALLS